MLIEGTHTLSEYSDTVRFWGRRRRRENTQRYVGKNKDQILLCAAALDFYSSNNSIHIYHAQTIGKYPDLCLISSAGLARQFRESFYYRLLRRTKEVNDRARRVARGGSVRMAAMVRRVGQRNSGHLGVISTATMRRNQRVDLPTQLLDHLQHQVCNDACIEGRLRRQVEETQVDDRERPAAFGGEKRHDGLKETQGVRVTGDGMECCDVAKAATGGTLLRNAKRPLLEIPPVSMPWSVGSRVRWCTYDM